MNDTRNYLSIGPLYNFSGGWALFPFVGKCAHYWREDKKTLPPQIGDGGRVRYFQSLCHVTGVTDAKVPALPVGTWPKCLRCVSALRVMKRHGRSS